MSNNNTEQKELIFTNKTKSPKKKISPFLQKLYNILEVRIIINNFKIGQKEQ